MVDSVGFVDAVSGSPEYSGRTMRQLLAPGFAGATSTRPLGARTGVRPGTPSDTVTVSGSTWTCKPLSGVADIQTAASAGPYTFSFDANDSGSVNAAHATLARKDIIYVKIEDPAEDASSVPLASRGYLAGTAAGSPVAPSAPSGAFTIAVLNVLASGGGATTVTWSAPYMAAAGGAVTVSSATELAAFSPNDVNTVAIMNGSVFTRSGSTWVMVPRRLGHASKAFTDTLLTTAYTDVLTVTATSSGSEVHIQWTAECENADSGGDRWVQYKITCDGVDVSNTFSETELPQVDSGLTPNFIGSGNGFHTPSAGSHTWVLKAKVDQNSSVYNQTSSLVVFN